MNTMNTLNMLIKILLNSKNKKNLSKQRVDYLLSALAISALSSQAQAESGDKSYKIDVVKLAEEAGVEITDVNKVGVRLAEGVKGEIVNLGNGIFEVFLADGVSEVNFIVSGSGLASTFTSSFSANSVSALKQDFANSWNDFIDSLNTDSSNAAKVTADFDMAALGLAVVAVAVSGGSSTVATVATVLTDFSLTVSKGTLQNAQVFLDADDDGVLDWVDADEANGTWDLGEGEQWALTDASGVVSFTQVDETINLVAQAYKVGGVSQTVDALSGSNVENLLMKAEAGASVITPLTTLVSAGLDNSDVLEILGFDATAIAAIGDINTYNPFSGAETTTSVAYEKIAAQTFTVLNTISEAISASETNADADAVFSFAAAELVELLEVNIAAVTVINLADPGTLTTIINETISSVDAAKGTSVSENLSYNSSSIIASIATAITNTNTQIQSITFDSEATTFDSEVLSILNLGAEGLADQVKTAVDAQVAVKVEVERLDAIIAAGDETDADVIAAVAARTTELTTTFEANTKIAAAADIVQYISEDASTVNSTVTVTGNTGGSVDAPGTYGNLTYVSGSDWVYTPHTASNHGQALNDKQTYTETFVITEGSTTYDVTVVLLGSNDAAVITAADPSAITEGTTSSDVIKLGTATHTDVDANNSNNLFTAVIDKASTYGKYTVDTGGNWSYTLDSTNATIDALGEGQSTTDTITVTAEDGTTEDIIIAINGTNDAAVITAANDSVAEGNATTGSSSSNSQAPK